MCKILNLLFPRVSTPRQFSLQCHHSALVATVTACGGSKEATTILLAKTGTQRLKFERINHATMSLSDSHTQAGNRPHPPLSPVV